MYTPKQEKLFYNTSKKWLSSSAKVIEISELKDVLRYHEWKYYVRNSPTLADYEYDQLYKQLEAIEAANPNLITQDSPTQRVADDLSGNLDPVAHVVPMLSLANSYNAEDLASFDKSIKRYLNIPEEKNIEYSVEPKFDGGSIAVLYENDFLIRAATRGNGTMGEEMTANARTMPSIPLRAPLAELGIYKAEMRGEALIRKDNFAKINAQRETDGHALFANPRNAATGGLRTKDPNETRNRELEAFIFQLAYAVDKNGNDKLQELNTHYESIELMGQLGFKIPQNEMKTCVNIKEVADYCATWEDKREKYEYEVDGLVVKVNDLKLQERSGSTQHHPRWAIAYKFKAKQATSILTDIEYQVGKIGSITPVAKIEPVQLAGVTVSSVSLHNEDFIKTKDLRIGDTILVERAGDVIPYIVKSMEELRDGSQVPVEYPTVCPINPDTDNPVTLVKEEGESAWRCLKCTCGQQDLQRMIFHVSKNAMDIDGFGKSYVENFHSHGWLKDISDVYNLDYNAIKTLEGFGSKSAEKLLSAVNKAKGNPIHRLLHSLSIHHLGKKASKLIAAEINHVFDLQYWNKEKFTSIKDIGPVVADNVIAYFSDPDHIAMLHRIEEHGVNMKQTKEDRPLVVSEDAPLSGKTILFTGSLQLMGRKEAQKLAEQNGAKNISAVSSNLNILVAGEKAGSKLKKAQALGSVLIMTEEEFVALIEE
jgi:DNA ligase (NAD+)